jgi:hypothetical protein
MGSRPQLWETKAPWLRQAILGSEATYIGVKETSVPFMKSSEGNT